MKKVRVKQIGEMYYPQYRFMFIWNNFLKSTSPESSTAIKFGTLKEAIMYARSTLIKVHEVTL